MFNIIAAILSSWRLTQIVTEDKVFDPIRNLFKNYPKVLLFFSCARCVSVWCGLISLILYLYTPYINWIFAFSMTLGLFSMSSTWINQVIEYHIDKVGPKITLRPTPNATSVELNKVSQEEAKRVIFELAKSMNREQR